MCVRTSSSGVVTGSSSLSQLSSGSLSETTGNSDEDEEATGSDIINNEPKTKCRVNEIKIKRNSFRKRRKPKLLGDAAGSVRFSILPETAFRLRSKYMVSCGEIEREAAVWMVQQFGLVK